MYQVYLINKEHGIKFGEVPEYNKFVSCGTSEGVMIWQHVLTDEDLKIMIYTFHSRMKADAYAQMLKTLPPAPNNPSPSGRVPSPSGRVPESSSTTSSIEAAGFGAAVA